MAVKRKKVFALPCCWFTFDKITASKKTTRFSNNIHCHAKPHDPTLNGASVAST